MTVDEYFGDNSDKEFAAKEKETEISPDNINHFDKQINFNEKLFDQTH